MPKAKVINKIKASLKALQSALKDNPDNLDLLLFTALTAHYAYNLDINSANDTVKQSLEKAHTLTPDDVRVDWFKNMHLCQANFIDVGMTGFLQIESSTTAAQAPADFWQDYMACATVAGMPSHVLRAAAKVPDTERSDFTRFLISSANKRMIPADPQASYEVKKVWSSTNGNGGPVFINFMCGVSFWANGQWRLSFPGEQKGQCVAQLETGPYMNNGIGVIPNILLLARPARTGETLNDFLNVFIHSPNPTTVAEFHCPAAQCVTAEMVEKGKYKEAGDGHAIVTVFERDEPPFPGILFEQPSGPTTPSDGVVHTYHRDEHIQRFKGKMYYLVLLDSASSVLAHAKQDYESYLKAMQVE